MCGSDLESENALGTLDLKEMLKAKIPNNFQVLVETGGAAK
jgi:hypothetical protein